jgi:hypothetical protein
MVNVKAPPRGTALDEHAEFTFINSRAHKIKARGWPEGGLLIPIRHYQMVNFLGYHSLQFPNAAFEMSHFVP